MNATVNNEVEQVLAALAKVLPGHGRVLIIPHDYPDPDALASSAALQLLLAERYHLHGQIIFSGVVSRAENREMLRHFKYKLTTTQQWRPGKKKYPAIFVDTAPWHGNVTLPAFVKPIAVFDHHHPGKYKAPANMFIDINPAFGATSTRFWECLRTANIPIPRWLAAIMAYAITTETFDFIRHTSERDIKAYTVLFNQCRLQTLGQIKNAPLPRAYYGHLAEAVANAQTYGRVAWTNLTNVKQPEIIAEIADLLLRMERIAWAFCTGFIENRLIISIRSKQARRHCGKLLHALIDRENGAGGGHEQAAAGYIDLSTLSATERIQQRIALETKLLARIEGRPSAAAHPLLLSEDQTAP